MLTREEAIKYFDTLYEEGFCKEDLMIGLCKIFDDHEAQLKALKEKIEELDKLGSEMFMIDLLHGKDYKARSIVAMLFWEWRKAEARYKAEWSARRDNRQLSLLSISSSKAEVLFKRAYKILKDTK